MQFTAVLQENSLGTLGTILFLTIQVAVYAISLGRSILLINEYFLPKEEIEFRGKFEGALNSFLQVAQGQPFFDELVVRLKYFRDKELPDQIRIRRSLKEQMPLIRKSITDLKALGESAGFEEELVSQIEGRAKAIESDVAKMNALVLRQIAKAAAVKAGFADGESVIKEARDEAEEIAGRLEASMREVEGDTLKKQIEALPAKRRLRAI